jgi:hypothetical protein
MASNQMNQYTQSDTEEIYPIPEHFHGLMNQCSTTLAPLLSELTIKILAAFPKECQQ